MKETILRNKAVIVGCVLFTITAILLGYIALGFWAAFIFTFGYLGGFILWLKYPTQIPFKKLWIPFTLALLLFVLHKVEERERDFFPALSQITGIPVPDNTSVPAIMLYAIASVWLFIPIFIWRRWQFGYYLIWSFFASMGITELAHFVLPLFRNQPYGYFPGMWSVMVLAPVAWWGMAVLIKNQINKQ